MKVLFCHFVFVFVIQNSEYVNMCLFVGVSDAQLRDENGRIHLADMLSEEQRDLKLLQEFLLGDDDEEGMQRMRQFKWKDLGKFSH